jgi:signal transduction histidine kinase
LKLNFKNRLLLIFGISVLLIVAFTIVTFNSLNNLVENEDWVSHTQDVLFNLEQVESKIKDAETGQRGYLLSQNPVFLDDYYGAYEKTHNNLDKLKDLLKDNVTQSMKLDTLLGLIELRYQTLDERLNIGTSPSDPVLANEKLLSGKLAMDKIRSLIERMKAFERDLLAHRTSNATESAEATYLLAGIFAALAVLIIIMSFSFTMNEFQQRNAAELKLKDTIETLKVTNENLEQFAYVASHDLQEPLRKIRAFGDLLKSDFKDDLSPTAGDYIDRMQNAAVRMQVLINDLLNFSRASRNTGETESVVLRDMFKAVLSDLEISINESEAQIDLDVAGEIEMLGNKTQLNQLIQNLLSNAIKFRKKDVKPEIEISGIHINDEYKINGFNARPGYNYYKIDIKDNGIGFDEKYLDKIFTIFQRLHSKMEYKGTGIGLALCKKIVENHQGFITASSQPNIGTTFTIILPIK